MTTNNKKNDFTLLVELSDGTFVRVPVKNYRQTLEKMEAEISKKRNAKLKAKK